jgi:uncharacterized damage-inducible protein DinB
MSIAETFLPEFDQEMAITRRVLERIPDDKLGWKAHPKSNTIGWVGAHLAEIPGWVEGTLTQNAWDLNPPGGVPYQSPVLANVGEMLEMFDRNVAAGRKAIATTSDAEYQQPFSLLSAGQTFFTMPRVGVIRTWVLNHTVHHRAILTVYLRLNDIPLPGVYGPSGDEG